MFEIQLLLQLNGWDYFALILIKNVFELSKPKNFGRRVLLGQITGAGEYTWNASEIVFPV